MKLHKRVRENVSACVLRGYVVKQIHSLGKDALQINVARTSVYNEVYDWKEREQCCWKVLQ